MHRTVAGVQPSWRRRGVREPSSAGGARGRRPDHRPARRQEPRNVRREGHDRGGAGRADRRPPVRGRVPAARSRGRTERREVLVVDGLQGQSFGPVSFTLDAGEIVGIAGAEGNGQPQLFDCLAGRQPPKAGRVVCDGKELSLISTHEAVGAGVMLLPGDRKHEALMPVLGVKVNTTIQSLRRFSVLGLLRRRRERRAVTDLVEQLEIRTPSLEQPVEFLSGGNQQKVSVARTLLQGAVGDPGLRADAGRRRRLPVRHLQGLARAHRQRGRRCSSSRATPSSSPGCATGCW